MNEKQIRRIFISHVGRAIDLAASLRHDPRRHADTYFSTERKSALRADLETVGADLWTASRRMVQTSRA